MTKRRVELAICAAMALLFGARGLTAIASQSYWLSSRTTSPRHFEGAPAIWLGIGEFGLAALIIGGWLWFSCGRRSAGATVVGAGALAAFGGFSIGLPG